MTWSPGAPPRNTAPGLGTDRPPHRSHVLPSLIGPVLVVAVVALVGFVLLEFVKAIVVVVAYAVGGALIIVPLLLCARLLRGYHGAAWWRRLAVIVTVVVVGCGLLVIAHLLGHHGWLLIVIPAGLVAISRVGDRLSRHRLARRRAAARQDRPAA